MKGIGGALKLKNQHYTRWGVKRRFHPHNGTLEIRLFEKYATSYGLI